jgi:hypothetical protein
MEYWDLLNKKLNPKELAGRESMRRLNKARVALKHHGTFPSDLDIEAFRATATSFFQDNTPIVFGLNLDDVSLVEYVSPERSRTLLKEAQAAIKNGEILEALDKVGIAYAEMISDYEDRKRDRFYQSPFHFGPELTFHDAFSMSLRGNRSPEVRRLAEFVDRVKESIEAIQGAIKVLALGMDYRKYSKFKRLTPLITRMGNGDWYVVRHQFDQESTPTRDDALFAIDFVIESALALAEFDYSLSHSAKP